MKRAPAQVIEEYGPFGEAVGGVGYDGQQLWLATGDRLQSVDPDSGQAGRAIGLAAHAGTAFDGRHLFQIEGGHIHKIDAATGEVLATIPVPGEEASGLAWAEGMLWVGQYRERKIHQVDPQTGTVLRTLESNRFVTGVTWVEGELWHGTWEEDRSELRRIDAQSGQVLEALEMPAGIGVSGLDCDGEDRFFCGGGDSGKLRVVRRPRRTTATE